VLLWEHTEKVLRFVFVVELHCAFLGGGVESKLLYVCVNVMLQTVRSKAYYLHYCYRHPTAASDTAVSLGQHPICEAAEVTVELPSKFCATREKTTYCRYGTILYHIGLERLLLFNGDLLDNYLVGV